MMHVSRQEQSVARHLETDINCLYGATLSQDDNLPGVKCTGMKW